MKTLQLVLCGALVGAIGCGKTDNGEFNDSVPTQDNVALVVPASSAGVTSAAAVGANLAVRDSAGLGALATDYVLTATVVAVVNTATAAVLTLVKDITEYPPTSVSGDTAVWGPGTDALSANTYRLTVTRVDTRLYRIDVDEGLGLENGEYSLTPEGSNEVFCFQVY